VAAPVYRSCAATDPGHVRRRNEDSVFASDELGVYFVVDGMGGQNAGDVAAQLASETLKGRLERRTSTPERRIREAIVLANNAVFEKSQQRRELQGMGCVLTVAVVEDGKVHYGHVGDTRLYLIRNGEIRKLTSDHSPVGELEDGGQIGEREAMAHPRRNEVFRDAGSAPRDPDDPFFIEYKEESFPNDAALLLCSDGLSDVLTKGEIRSIVEDARGNPRRVAGRLIDAANENSKDNVSAVYVEGPGFAPGYAGDDTEKQSPPGIRRALLAASYVAALCIGFYLAWWLLSPKPPRVLQVAPSEIPSIAQALEMAQAGDTVNVAPGDYREQIRMKEGVRIAGNQAVLIVASGQDAAVVADGIGHASLAGFTIRSEGPYDRAVRIESSGVDLERLHVSGAQRAAITIGGGSTGRISASTLQNNVVGIEVTGAAAPVIEYNVFHGNKLAIDWRSTVPETKHYNTFVKELVKEEEKRP
jgi:serine/threonine protein phosphatase PrpC